MSEEHAPALPPTGETGPATPPPPPPKPRRRLWRALAWTLAALVLPLAVAALLGALLWAVSSPAGSAWVLAQVPGVQVTAPEGSLVGEFAAERVEIALPGAAGANNRIVIGRLHWQGLKLRPSLTSATWLRVSVETLQAERVDVLVAPDPAAPPLTPPQTLRLPVEVDLRAVDIGELHAAALGEQPLRDLHAKLHLAADAGRSHRVDTLSLGWDRIAGSGALRIATDAPFDVDAQLAVVPRQDAAANAAAGAAPLPAFDATLAVRGPLTTLAVQATLRGTLPGGRRGVEPPSLDLTATVLPFAPWPLGTMQAQTRALDLSALHGAAPGTSLSGTADVTSQGTDRPARVAIALTNARAGRFDEGLLPVRSLNADVRARPDDPQQVEIHALDVVLGTARAAGGRVQGSGQWTPQRATLSTTLTDIAPRALDAGAPQMRLSGTAELGLDNGGSTAAGSGGRPAPSLTLRSRIAGNLLEGPRQDRLQLELDATANASRIELRRAELRAGDARATLVGQGLRQGRGWAVRGQGTLADFNPALWWPGPEGSAWRKGPHRFNGTLDVDALLPTQATTTAAVLSQLAAAQGQASLRITDSLLAGAPLAGELALRGEGSGLGVTGSLAAAGATLGLRGRLDAAGRDHWELDGHAADLATLAPLLKLAQPPGKAAPALAGALDAQLQLDGRWPQLATRGKAELKSARAAGMALAQAGLRWTVSTAPDAPLDIQLDVDRLEHEVQKLDKLRLTVQGSAAQHRIALDAESPVRPPRWIDLLHGADPAANRGKEGSTGTLAVLRAHGALQFDTAWQQPLKWRGHVEQADARRRGGSLPAPWFHVGEADIDAQYDPLTRTPRVTVSQGRMELPNLALRWSQFLWQGGSSPLLDADATFEPFRAAPLLARLQPEFGWSGDLVLAGRVAMHSRPTFVAEIEFGRQSGDLSITDEAGTQPLELTDLRVALEARDGVWNFTQALAGRKLGALGGAITVRTDPKLFWPPADAPLQGVMELQVADLAAWGAWAPAGWRVRGALHASASFGGQFGAPEYTGQVEGSGIGMRNLVEGIDVHDGELEIVLKGETAQIVKLQARAGDGSVKVGGDAVFGASPQARLNLTADKLLLLGRVDRRIVASGNATLQLDPRLLQLDGRFTIDQGLIDFSRGNAPSLGDDVTVLREPAATAAEATPRSGPTRDVKMNLTLNLGSALRLRGRGLDTRLAGELLLTAPNGRLAVNGTVNAVQGTYAAYGQNLRIERGAVTFSGAVDNPRLDILAIRPNVDVVVGVAITGSVNAPRIALYSEPDMADNDKLSWLVLGRAPDGLPGSDTALLQAAAMALLAGEGGDGLGSQLARLNPLDTLSVRQTDGVVRNTVVSVGKQLSQRWYIGYERSLNATAGNWQLIYRLAQRFTVRLQTGLDNSIDLIWSWRWD